MLSINPYLNFQGNTEEAFNFYKSVFGSEFVMLQRFSDTPHGAALPEHERNKIMHVALPIGQNLILMGTDGLESMGQKVSPGNNFSLAIGPSSEAEAEDIFKKLSEGGQVTMPLEKTFWNAYFGMLKDKFGIQWMVNYDYGQRKS